MQPADGTYLLCEILFICLLFRMLLNANKSTLYEIHVCSVRYPHKNWSPGDGGQVCITKAKWVVLGKVAVRNDIGSDYLKKWVRFESFLIKLELRNFHFNI
jgi:hypothetical protein